MLHATSVERKRSLRGLFLAILSLPLLFAESGRAHHSFVAEFTESMETITGVISEVLYRNPHVRIYVRVDAEGTTTTWEVQTQSPLTLDRYGLPKEIFAPGTKVTVLGFRGRDGARKLFLRELTLPTGEVVRPNPSQRDAAEYEEIF